MFSTLEHQPHPHDYNRKHLCVFSTGLWGQCFTGPFTTAATSVKLCTASYLLLTSSGSWMLSSSAGATAEKNAQSKTAH